MDTKGRISIVIRRALTGAGAMAIMSSPAVAQQAINQPIADEYGVERKTGRALFPLPEIINIGGEGAASISVSYVHADGSGFSLPILPTKLVEEVRPQEGVYSPPQALERYLLHTINYEGISERFRNMWSGSGYSTTFQSEYPTGSSFDGTTFTDKHGLKIVFGNSQNGFVDIVQYPDGTTKTFDMTRIDEARSISNNFGYALKVMTVGDVLFDNRPYDPFTTTFQAINLREDYCSLQSVGLCGNLSRERRASLEAISQTVPIPNNANGYEFYERFVLTDAMGGRTLVRNELLSGIIRPPFCVLVTIPGSGHGTTITYDACSIPQYGWRPYPVALTQVGSNVETHVIDYNVQPGQIFGDNFDKIRITQVVKDGVIVDYEPIFIKPSSSYGGGSFAPSWLYLTSKINGQEISYSQAYGLHPFFGQSRTALTFVRDANGRSTTFPYNSLWEINGETYPEGNGVTYVRDARQNIMQVTNNPKPNSGAVTQSTSYTYLASCSAATQAYCNKPTTMTDPRGAITNYEYNQYGQLVRQISPAPAAGAPRPTLVNEYTFRTAYIKNSAGAPVPAGPPISLLTRSYTCISSAICNASTPAVDRVVTDYDYGPTTGLNNLRLRGVAVTAANGAGQIETLRTCYVYNYFGERIAETKPLGTGATCS